MLEILYSLKVSESTMQFTDQGPKYKKEQKHLPISKFYYQHLTNIHSAQSFIEDLDLLGMDSFLL